MKRYCVHVYNVITTDRYYAEVFEEGDLMDGHSSIGAIDSVREKLGCMWPGAVMSRALPEDIDAMPVDEERFKACRQYRRQLADLCERVIRCGVPDLERNMTFNDGEGRFTAPRHNRSVLECSIRVLHTDSGMVRDSHADNGWQYHYAGV